MRVSTGLAVAVLFCCAAGGVWSADTPPDDDFLEYLGAWDDALQQACDEDGELPGDAACVETEDDE